MAQRLTIRMNRANSGQSWGFRLNGGMEYGLPMTILTIVRNSVCDRCGLRPRDRVVQINNMNVDGATHQQTKMEIIRSGLEMDMVVYRDPPGTNPVQMTPAAQPPAPKPQNDGYLQGYGPVLAPVTKPTSQPAPAPAAAPAPAPAAAPAPAPAAAPVPAPAPEPTPAPAPVPDAAPVQEVPTTETDAPSAKPTEEAAPAPAPVEAPKEEPAPASSESKPDEPVVTIAPLTVETDIDIPADAEVLSPKEVLASPAFKEMPAKVSKPGGVKKAIPNVTHSKYNSPMGLYSADNIASVYAAQTEGIEREMESLDVSKAPVGTKMTGALQVID